MCTHPHCQGPVLSCASAPGNEKGRATEGATLNPFFSFHLPVTLVSPPLVQPVPVGLGARQKANTCFVG